MDISLAQAKSVLPSADKIRIKIVLQSVALILNNNGIRLATARMVSFCLSRESRRLRGLTKGEGMWLAVLVGKRVDHNASVVLWSMPARTASTMDAD